ncbi:TPR repeat-containing protein [Marinospirillum celere]|uniref:TPR repeat-containing protein n=1 Tax=Marinospirillum celere TaxID=1122252 RepID=A0A1I1E8T4_9GAMM|nr:TPR repeat-containing protein [Marinospirillum celere]
MSKTAFAKGNQLFRENKLEEAIEEYKKSLNKKETYFAYENLGMALELLNKSKEAGSAYQESLKINGGAKRAIKFLEKNKIKPQVKFENDLESKNIHPVELIKKYSSYIDCEALKNKYYSKGLDKVDDTFCLVRIIGNDLYPRHKKGQSRKNIKFILENEPEYSGLEKMWIVNRIFDKKERNEIIKVLKKYKQDFIEIKFDESEYKKIPFDTDSLPTPWFLNTEKYQNLSDAEKNRVLTSLYRYKNNYVMNNNGARNVALIEAKKRAKWALPWDGNCYLTPDAWQAIQRDVTTTPWYSHFVVPMARVLSNNDLINNENPPDPVEEPQLIFRKDTLELFNEEFCYGRRPKVELFWALGIPGKWDRWKDEPWDQVRRNALNEAKQFAVAGWVARLYSGMGSLEKDTRESFLNRGQIRQEAIVATLREIDKQIGGCTANKKALQFYKLENIANIRKIYISGCDSKIKKYVDVIIKNAEDALTRSPYSVIDKTTFPPSGDKQDYWHPAPYWWPDPSKKNGLPYIRKDGERVPGTRMYDQDSEKYDRTRVQRVFDDSTSLMLAWYMT